MSKQGLNSADNAQWFSLTNASEDWNTKLSAVATRYNRAYRQEAFELPAEVEAMPIFREWTSGSLEAKVASPFWEVAQPKKGQRCLDIGCGVSFLIYPWRDWGALFYGLEISTVAQEGLNARGPQLNSKLYKGVELGAAHALSYPDAQFDLAIATGWSCYYSLSYWETVVVQVKRVLQPGGVFVFDALNPDAALAENWAILETYLGAEVFLEPLAEWEAIVRKGGAKIVKQQPGELFTLYKAQF
ncbi:MAG: class I SAM-dependent methyltransferase [Desertifilum sp.]|nr:class I SAM-dependent methyltransferase [Desertifilum sp.]